MALFVKLARKDELNRRLRRLPDAAQQHVRKAVEKSAALTPSPPMLNGRLAPTVPMRWPKLARRAVP